MICKVCKKFFIPHKEQKYMVKKRPEGILALTTPSTIYEAFDCPRCGCQNIVNQREVNYNETVPASDRSIREN